ncbi:Diamine acetyltransferase 1 [Halotydeus destructor]|nr:Diamine acetyltransferase 1 [Halotydeus destructor]
MIVRPLVLSDVAVIVKLIDEMMAYHHAHSPVTSSSLIRDTGLDGKSSEVCKVLVAEKCNEILGYVLFYTVHPTSTGRVLYMDDIYVRRGYRRLGVGTRLLQELCRIAVQEKR